MTNQPIDPTIATEIQAPIDATIEQRDGRWSLVMRRAFRHSPTKLWQMITEPEQLARWSPIVPDRPLTHVGPATCRENPGDDPIDAEVLIANEPHELVHRWGENTMRWIITAENEGSVLELRQTFADREAASLAASGWQVCFGTLAASHDSVERERVVGHRAMDYGWRELHALYQQKFASESAE